jgi:hypothetical protein
VPKGLYGKGLSYDDPSQDLHVHLQPGQQHLTGYQAMGFVRWRQYRINGPGDGDEGRTARQRAFFRALTSRVAGKLSQRNLEAARTAANLAAVAHKHMTTDLSPFQLMAVASMAREVDASGIEGVMVPTEWSGMYGEEWIYRPDPQGTQRAIIDMWAALEGRRSLTDTARVEVLNACGKQSAADQCKRVLGEAGLKVVKSGTALDRAGQPDFSHTATVVRCTEKFARAGERVLAVLQIPGAEIRYDLTESREFDISVILGSDYPPREVGAVRRAEAGVRVGEQVQAHG